MSFAMIMSRDGENQSCRRKGIQRKGMGGVMTIVNLMFFVAHVWGLLRYYVE